MGSELQRSSESTGPWELTPNLFLLHQRNRPRGEKALVQITQLIRPEQGITARIIAGMNESLLQRIQGILPFSGVFLLMRRSGPCRYLSKQGVSEHARSNCIRRPAAPQEPLAGDNAIINKNINKCYLLNIFPWQALHTHHLI